MVNGELIPSTQRASHEQLSLAQRSGTPLPPGTAEALREFAGLPAVRGALRRLAGKEEPWVVVLNASKETRLKLRTGEFALTKTRDGRTLAQTRSKGRVAENIDFTDVTNRGKGATAAKAASAGAAVAWQAMAIATQQHYLVEISGRLSRIEAGVTEIIDRERHERAALLTSTIDNLDLIELHLAEGSQLGSNDRQSVLEWHKQARTVAEAAVADVHGILDQPERDPIEAMSDLALADRAAAVAARCAATLLRMHYETEEKRLTEFWHYSERTDRMVTSVDAAFERVNSDLKMIAAEWRAHLDTKPSSVHKQLWNLTGGRVTAHIGATKPRLQGSRALVPEQIEWIRARATSSRSTPETPTEATIVIDEHGARLLPSSRN